MKTKANAKINLIIIIAFILNSCYQANHFNSKYESKFSKLSGPYLGQKPPGLNPEMFAPGLLSAGNSEVKITFSPDGTELCYFFSSRSDQWLVEPTGLFNKMFIMYTKMKNGHWIEPHEFSFNPERKEYYPFFSPDGETLYFNSDRSGAPRMWYVNRQDSGWSEPQVIRFRDEFESEGLYLSIARNGNLYFGMSPDGINTFIYYSRNENGLYSIPERLDNLVNDVGGGHHPYIAPDESYIIFDYRSTMSGSGEEDLYISFRGQNGEWSKPKNMGRTINSMYRDKKAFVSFDGKYLFFTSNRISSEIPKGPINLKQLQQLTSVPANGFQHLYWVDAKIINELKLQY